MFYFLRALYLKASWIEGAITEITQYLLRIIPFQFCISPSGIGRKAVKIFEYRLADALNFLPK
ncbi:hypothetical protein QF041_005172 [Paenibacillus sp. W2I17]|nr:hypothetical protein [Paenibacillus sp. W2I17]